MSWRCVPIQRSSEGPMLLSGYCHDVLTSLKYVVAHITNMLFVTHRFATRFLANGDQGTWCGGDRLDTRHDPHLRHSPRPSQPACEENCLVGDDGGHIRSRPAPCSPEAWHCRCRTERSVPPLIPTPSATRLTAPERRTRTTSQPRSTGFELVDDEEASQHRFLAYTFPSRWPGTARPVVPNRPDFVAAAPTLPGDPQFRLPPTSPSRYDDREMQVSHLHPKQQRVVAHNMLIDPDGRDTIEAGLGLDQDALAFGQGGVVGGVPRNPETLGDRLRSGGRR